MAENQYFYGVARIRTMETALLGRSDLDQLMNCKSEAQCLRFLIDKGWGRTGEENAGQILGIEREKTWGLIGELVEDLSVFHTFLYGSDFHNLKAAIKQAYLNTDIREVYIRQGTCPPEEIIRAVNEHDFNGLPEHLKGCAQEAYQVMMHTGDGCLCDVIIDRAALEITLEKGKATKNELFEAYAQLKMDAANINIAVRCCRTGKDKDFLERALAEGGSLEKGELIQAAFTGIQAIYDYLLTTEYESAVAALQESSSAFECWCDNLLIRRIQPQKYNPFTVSPLAAYILARENEIKTVRIILSGKRNEIADHRIRERLRETYV